MTPRSGSGDIMIEPAMEATNDDVPAVPFRLMAIVSREVEIDDLYLLSERWPQHRFGVMLRDPEHRPGVVARLGAYALHTGPPAGVTLIANAVPVPGIGYLHCTSRELYQGKGDSECVGDAALVIGYSVHDLREAEQGVAAGARYITFSPIFPTRSKPGHPGAGLDSLRRICAAVPLPVFALGGITAANAAGVLDAGAWGIASISLFAPKFRPELELLLGNSKKREINSR
jgi:hypothetical protein